MRTITAFKGRVSRRGLPWRGTPRSLAPARRRAAAPARCAGRPFLRRCNQRTYKFSLRHPEVEIARFHDFRAARDRDSYRPQVAGAQNVDDTAPDTRRVNDQIRVRQIVEECINLRRNWRDTSWPSLGRCALTTRYDCVLRSSN